MPRTKVVKPDSIDDSEYKIASLTMDQMEEHWETIRSGDARQISEASWSAVVNSINNAGGSVDVATMKSRLTFQGFNEIQEEVMSISGFKRQTNTGEGPATVQ